MYPADVVDKRVRKDFGDTSHHDDRVTRGSFVDHNAIAFYLDNDRLVGTLHTGQADETEEELKQLIRTRARTHDVRALTDESVELHDAFVQNTT